MAAFDPTNTTPGDLGVAALQLARVVGLGQTATADQLTQAIQHLQWMLQQWERERWLVYHLVTYGVVADGGNSWSVGPGGQINTSQTSAWTIAANPPPALVSGGSGYAMGDTLSLVGGATILVSAVASGAITGFIVTSGGSYPAPLPEMLIQTSTSGSGINATFGTFQWNLSGPVSVGTSVRPARIESAFVRQLQNTFPNQIDYPLQILQSREDYNRIALKQLVSFPKVVWYDSGWPLGTLYCYPVPNASIYGVFVSIMEQLPIAFATTSVPISLPYEYYYAIISNLALRLYMPFGKKALPGDPLPNEAKNSLKILRGANTQIAQLAMPGQLARPGLYNVYSDQNY